MFLFPASSIALQPLDVLLAACVIHRERVSYACVRRSMKRRRSHCKGGDSTIADHTTNSKTWSSPLGFVSLDSQLQLFIGYARLNNCSISNFLSDLAADVMVVTAVDVLKDVPTRLVYIVIRQWQEHRSRDKLRQGSSVFARDEGKAKKKIGSGHK